MALKRFRLSRMYDPGKKDHTFLCRHGSTSKVIPSLEDMVEYISENRRMGGGFVDIIVEFNTDDEIEWVFDESLPRRYAPLSPFDREIFFGLLAKKG